MLWLNYSQQLQVLKSIYSQLCFRNCRDQGLNEMNWPAQTKPPPKNNYLLYLLCIDSEDWRMIQSISNKQQKQWYWKKIFRISWLFCCITSWNEYWLLYTHCNFCAAEFILWVFLSLRCGTECSGNANIACIEHLQGEDYHHPPLPYLKYNNICQLSFYAFNSTKTVLFFFSFNWTKAQLIWFRVWFQPSRFDQTLGSFFCRPPSCFILNAWPQWLTWFI